MRTLVLLFLVLAGGLLLIQRWDPGALLRNGEPGSDDAVTAETLPPAVQAIDQEIRRVEAVQAEVGRAANLAEHPAHRASYQAELTRLRHSLKQLKIQRNALLDPQPPVGL